MRRTVQAAICLPLSVTKVIKDIENERDAFLCLNNLRPNSIFARTMNELPLYADCRPVSAFIHSLSIKSAIFM